MRGRWLYIYICINAVYVAYRIEYFYREKSIAMYTDIAFYTIQITIEYKFSIFRLWLFLARIE